MKIAITADLHLFNYHSNKQNEIISTMNNLIEKCRNMKISTIFIVGDIFHGKSVIHSLSLSKLLDIFRNNKKINFVTLDGNHDLSGKNEQVTSALKCLDYEPNVCRVETSQKLDDFFFVPYSYNMVDTIKTNSAKYLISHLGVNEGILNSGISIVSDIRMKDFDGRYQKIFLGHYHKPQEIHTDNCILYYCGSPCQLDWGESDDEKRFLILDTKTDEVQSILTEGYKKHIKIKMTKENSEKMIKLARCEKNKGNHVRIEIQENIDIDMNLKNEFQIVNKAKQELTNRGIDIGMSIEDKIKKYIKIKNIPSSDYNSYLDTAIDIVRCES